jgi:formylglycine-generating enzyme required for sulfatase activity
LTVQTVFFSYTRRDPEYAGVIDAIFAALIAEGFAVFRDVEGILPGDLWQHRIGRELEQCGCGVALWTPNAATSEIMLAETAYLIRENRYVPICLGNSGAVPFVYRSFQHALLRDFDGDRDDAEWRKLVLGIRRKLEEKIGGKGEGALAAILQASGLRSEDIERVDPKTRESPSQRSFQEGEGFPLMRRIAPGRFMMGRADPEARANEQPQIAVTIERSIAVGVFPVTFYEWNLAARSGALDVPERNANGADPSWPVVGVSWLVAERYIAWLNARVGAPDAYRLPTEAEWEYWAALSAAAAPEDEDDLWRLRSTTRPVWEWTEDTYFPSHVAAHADGSARQIRGNPYRTVRGGSWRSPLSTVSPTMRSGFDQAFSRNDIGFRVVRVLD